VVAKFGEEIEDACGHGPTKRQMAPQLGGGIISDEQHACVDWVWRHRPELIAPKSNCPTCLEFARDEANGDRPFAGVGDELEVPRPRFAIRVYRRGHFKDRAGA
jgi:hypothetical protein